MTIPILKPGEELGEFPFGYVIAKGGHYLKKRTPLFEACVRVDENPNLEEEREFFRLTAPKIPSALFSRILAFFDAVGEEMKTEATVLLVFEDNQWDTVVPDQETTATSVRYTNTSGVRLAGSIHSHPQMSAAFSSTDEHDEAGFDGIHVVVADRGFLRPEISCAAVVSGRRIDLDPEDVIEGYDDGIDFPAEWLDKIRPETVQKRLLKPGDGFRSFFDQGLALERGE